MPAFISRRITRPRRRFFMRNSKWRTKSSASSSTAISLSRVILKTPCPVTLKSGKRAEAKCSSTSSIMTTSRCFFPSRIKRGTCAGTGSNAYSGSCRPLRLSPKTIPKPRLGICGKGCAGSIAIGVRSGKIFCA